MRSFPPLLSFLCVPFILSGTQVIAQGQGCPRFDGVDDRITVSNTALNTIGAGDFTVEAWIRGLEADQGQHARILSNRVVAGQGFIFFLHGYWGGSQYMMVSVQIDGFNYLHVNNGTYAASVLDGNCHHIACSRSGNTLTFYADGMPLGTRLIQTSNPTVASTSASLTIGRDVVDAYSFDGNITEVRIWDHARSDADILQDMNQNVPGSSPGLLSYWRLDDGGGQSVADAAAGGAGTMGHTMAIEPQDPTWTTDCCSFTTVGLPDVNGPSEPGLYPNPTEGIVFIPPTGVATRVQVMDASGRIALEHHTNGSVQSEMNLTSLAPGAYLVVLSTEHMTRSLRMLRSR
ncbi:MAG: T9SS type A sorting domain-containing protein [Flavobacteriales bacterium]|nr:T9SS type A sorting domain-containing protein [Flavobacteriales bacterium]